jgi:predicted DsbA family dithiol-disulfide isomerase
VKIEIWSDVACPWCYIGLNRFQSALDSFEHADDVSVQLRSFQLDPGLPESFAGSEVDYLASSKGIESSQAAAMTEQVAAVGRADGLPFDFASLRVANSRRAHRLVHLAQHHDPSGNLAWELKRALFTAHFAEGSSIWDQDALIDLAASLGLPKEDAAAALDSTSLDDEVANDIERAGQLGIRAVPTFVFEEKYGISGAQSTEAFAAALDQVWRELNPEPLITLAGVGENPACGVDGCTPAS